MARAEFLKQRADKFLENAQDLIEKKTYFLAAFNLEQAAQLYLKYYLFKKLRDFPRVHNLGELLKGLGHASEKEKRFESFRKENEDVISDLNQAYITSRYLPVQFSGRQVERMEQFVKDLIVFLESL